MKLRYPLYYKKFACTADRCSDNCCIGWEIDIDRKTEGYYESVKGAFGERLRANIKDGSFILQGERCPFLNEKGLCDIIIELGEGHLCQICDRHPRYFGWYGDIKECGLGLSCEEAARLILTEGTGAYCEEDIPQEETDEVEVELFDFLSLARDKIFRFLESDLPFKAKLCSLLDYADPLQDCLDFGEYELPEIEISTNSEKISAGGFIALFEGFEPIDENWSMRLEGVKNKKPVRCDGYLSKIFIYFIWRYFMRAVLDGDVYSKIYLAAIGCIMIAHMADGDSLSEYIDAAKLYSKEMDYCEENMDKLTELIYTEDVLSPQSLKALCNN